MDISLLNLIDDLEMDGSERLATTIPLSLLPIWRKLASIPIGFMNNVLCLEKNRCSINLTAAAAPIFLSGYSEWQDCSTYEMLTFVS